MTHAIPTYQDIENAQQRIQPHINKTPVFTSRFFNELTQAEIFFKCENFQRVGAFKIRGATNAVFQLTEDELKNGVVTHSSGNHAQALALAAKMRNAKAYIVMPDNAPSVKVNAVRGYGGEIIFCKNNPKERHENAERISRETGAILIPPYDHPHIIAGQGTAAKELIEETGKLDFIFAPIGGGGLMSGTSIASRHLCPQIEVIGCEPTNANDAAQSLQTGILQPALPQNTIADGLLTSLSELTFAIIQKNVSEIVTVDEPEIIQAMKWVWERMKIIIEPSSAVAVAALLKTSDQIKGKRAGVILTGGNVEFGKMVELFSQLSPKN